MTYDKLIDLSLLCRAVDNIKELYKNKLPVSGGTDFSLVTTGEKYMWNNKASTSVATTSLDGLMSSTDKTKLDGLTDLGWSLVKTI